MCGHGGISYVDELFAPDIVDHDPVPGQPRGVDGVKLVVAMFRRAFPDLVVTCEDVVAEDDRVVIRWTAEGTHLGRLLGAPATGRHVVLKGIDIVRCHAGRIVERWGASDVLGLLGQLGTSEELLR